MLMCEEEIPPHITWGPSMTAPTSGEGHDSNVLAMTEPTTHTYRMVGDNSAHCIQLRSRGMTAMFLL
jgi:hypothetical protein